ncbi:hypothetical protein CIG11343_0595 [Campylobacter iguaniorum]|uniref:hypothetical protein n=1 Tax=Campylobacter iguaniorum TaxID=1244531 RepID=UPI0007C8BD2A|nr:hypothetical protein [Campylobacter iguaniorum]ANE35656.1 hypothetical protein CIG11343_0595 [Campylobacter iguaniorum]
MIYDKDTFKIVNQCLDTLVIGVRCYNPQIIHGTFATLLDNLRALKDQAKNIKTFGDKFVKSDLGLNFGDFFVSSRSSGNYLAYVKNQDISIYFANSNLLTNRYHLKIEFRSKFLLQYGHVKAYEYVENFIKGIFLSYYEINILRFDLACDVANIRFQSDDMLRFQTLRKVAKYSDIKDFLIDDEDKELNLEMKSTDNLNYSRFLKTDGFSFGKSPFMFRIYDKIKQISQKQISTLIMLKWQMNGFNSQIDKSVFRFESEIHRPIFKKFISNLDFPNNDYKSEVDFLFSNLGFFWRYSLSFVKWHDLSEDEINKINSLNLGENTLSKYYKKSETDITRFDLWGKIMRFDGDNLSNLQKYELISKIDTTKAKNALKSFVSSVYSNIGFDLDSFITVFSECEQELKEKGLSLHEYGLLKVCGKFVDTERKQNKRGIVGSNHFKPAIEDHILDIYNLFSRLKSNDAPKDDNYYTLKSTLDILHNIYKGNY